MFKEYSLTITCTLLAIFLYSTQTIYSMHDPMWDPYTYGPSYAPKKHNRFHALPDQTDTDSSDYDNHMYEAIRTDDTTKLLTIITSNPKAVHTRPRDSCKNTLIMAAINLQNLTALEILLEHGADVNAQNAFMQTALVHTINLSPLYLSQEIKTKIIEILVLAHSNLNIKSIAGDTALSLAGPAIRAIVKKAQEIINANTYFDRNLVNIIITYLNPFLMSLLYARESIPQ